jgi:hypothetical protein
MESCVRKKPANALPKHRHCRAGWQGRKVTSEAAVRQRGRISQNQGYCATRHDAADTAQATEKWRDATQSREVIPTNTLRC